MRNAAPVSLLASGFVALSLGCREPAPPVARPSVPGAVAPQPSPTPAAPVPPPRPLETLQAEGLPPLELSAFAVPGPQPLPTYRAIVRNACDRPVRRVVATVVYLGGDRRALGGENHDVAFGSPLKALDPGETLETSFLSRVEHAAHTRLVVRSVTFLEAGKGPAPVPFEWSNPRYASQLAEAEGAR